MKQAVCSGVLFILFLLISGCNNKYIDDIDRGAGYNYRPGYPELRLAATGYVDTDDNTKVSVSGDVVYGSLVFKEIDNAFEARIVVDIQIYDEENDKQMVASREFSRELRSEDPRVTGSQNVLRFEEVFDVPSGSYRIEAGVTDRFSARQSRQELKTSIPDPADSISHLTEIRILAKDNEAENPEFHPITTYDVAGRMDSLLFNLQVTNNNAGNPLRVESRLIRFRSDTSVTRPMSYNNYSPSHIAFRGLDFDETEEIQSSVRTLTQNGSVFIEYVFTDLPRGNYRLEVSAGEEGSDDYIYKARDFSVKSEHYPSLKTAEELARPLYYLMNDKEYKKLLSIQSPDSMKAAIDRFWLSNIQNSTKARNVITLYYERVEEANKQFSNFKEGWKTDPGMIYILFGPPWYVEAFADEMTWLYTYNRYDSEKVFNFKQPKLKTKYFPYNNYLLIRNNEYHSIQLRQRNKWLSGQILKDNL